MFIFKLSLLPEVYPTSSLLYLLYSLTSFFGLSILRLSRLVTSPPASRCRRGRRSISIYTLDQHHSNLLLGLHVPLAGLTTRTANPSSSHRELRLTRQSLLATCDGLLPRLVDAVDASRTPRPPHTLCRVPSPESSKSVASSGGWHRHCRAFCSTANFPELTVPAHHSPARYTRLSDQYLVPVCVKKSPRQETRDLSTRQIPSLLLLFSQLFFLSFIPPSTHIDTPHAHKPRDKTQGGFNLARLFAATLLPCSLIRFST